MMHQTHTHTHAHTQTHTLSSVQDEISDETTRTKNTSFALLSRDKPHMKEDGDEMKEMQRLSLQVRHPHKLEDL